MLRQNFSHRKYIETYKKPKSKEKNKPKLVI